MGLFGMNLFQIADRNFIPTVRQFLDHLWLLLENSPFKTCDGSTVCVGALCSAAGYLLLSP